MIQFRWCHDCGVGSTEATCWWCGEPQGPGVIPTPEAPAEDRQADARIQTNYSPAGQPFTPTDAPPEVVWGVI